MNSSDIIRLLSLAAIWGGSFLLMRIASPVLGSAYLAEGRVLLSAIFLYCLALHLKRNKNLLEHWKHYLIMGFFNSAFPFVLFGFAALNLSTSQLSILNSTAPPSSLPPAMWKSAVVIPTRIYTVRKLPSGRMLNAS